MDRCRLLGIGRSFIYCFNLQVYWLRTLIPRLSEVEHLSASLGELDVLFVDIDALLGKARCKTETGNLRYNVYSGVLLLLLCIY